MKQAAARTSPIFFLLLLATAAAPTSTCGVQGSAGGDGGSSDAGRVEAGGAEAGVADAMPVDAATPPDDASPVDAGPVDAAVLPPADASSIEAGMPLLDASEAGEGGAAEAGVGEAGAVAVGPQWASWPIPNPPSSGLPNPESYDTSVAGIVKDLVTGLMWQQNDVVGSYPTMQDAAAYCSALALGGYSDWRLPSRIELWSIEDFSHVGPALDPAFSSQASASNTLAPWTSTPGHGSFAFQGGTDYQGDQSVTAYDGMDDEGLGLTSPSVRCVRGSTAQPSPHYTVQGGTVHDDGTGLTWQQGYDPVEVLPSGAASYCASLTLGGGGWRVPSIKELESIVDDALIVPAIDAATFSLPALDAGPDYPWVFYTSSAVASSTGDSWTVWFSDGTNTSGSDSLGAWPYQSLTVNYHWVRCVK